MSRSNKTELTNPAERFFDWSGSEGCVQFFDKSRGEKGENVCLDFPFKFLVLDRVAQITGGIERNGRYEGFWSNAVKNLKTQTFTVKSKQGIEAQGLYADIKGTPGIKFMTGLYIAYNDNKELKIGYLKIKGAALTAWIEFTKTHRDIESGAFVIVDKEKCKKGSTVYYEPVFQYTAEVPEQVEAAAVGLDEKLQGYLADYFAQSGIAEVEQEYSQARAAGVPQYSGPSTDKHGSFPGDDGPEWNPTDEDAPEAFDSEMGF